MKTGLILEGGAMRGLFTCGVIDVLMENDITFDGGAGISAGAVFGCNYKSRQPGRAVRYNKRFCTDPRYGTIRSLIKTGDMYEVGFCYHELPDVLDPFDRETFRDDPMEFYIGAADLGTGGIVYHRCTDGGEEDIEWMRASASMPLVSRPVAIDGAEYLDGGVAESVPYRYMESIGYDRNVIVLTRPKGFVRKKTEAMPLIRIKLRKYPNAVKALETRHERYNRDMRQIDEREASGAAVIIRPPEELGVSRTEKDPDELERIYQIGRRTAESRLDEIRAFLNGDQTDSRE